MNDTTQQNEQLIGIGSIPLAEEPKKITPHIRPEKQLRPPAMLPKKTDGELAVDVYELDNHYYVVAPVAGVTLDDISVTITQDVLHISGNRSLTKDIPPQNYLKRECYFGPFSRAVILPPDADSLHIEASFTHSILTIKVGKRSLNQTHDIPISQNA